MFGPTTINIAPAVSRKTVKSITAGLHLSIIAIGLVVIGLASTAHAGPITTPTGLSPGDQYRLAFVTSTTRDATSSDIADYNAFVTNVANTQAALAALGTTWKAIAATATTGARDNTNTNFSSSLGVGVPIFLLDGSTRIATNYLDLWNGSIGSPLQITEAGTQLPLSFVWTGSMSNGVIAPTWRGLGVTFGPAVGNTGYSDVYWIFQQTQSTWFYSDDTYSLYALSGLLTAASVPGGPSIPEPATLALFGFGLVGLGLMRRRKAA